MVITGANAGDFGVSGIILPALVTIDGSVTFKIIFSPTGGCARAATLQITNSDTNRNPFTLGLSGIGAAAPVIISQPVSVTNYAGTSANFSVGASACTPLSYQWYLGTNSLIGETNSTLGIASVGPANVGDYHVVATTTGLSTNSNPATLTVIYQAPTIVGEQIFSGAGGFQLTFSGAAGQTYQVLASDDLMVPQSAWTVVGNGTFGNTNAIFIDTSATNQAGQFYTIKSP
jgi:hypothetical protein